MRLFVQFLHTGAQVYHESEGSLPKVGHYTPEQLVMTQMDSPY